MHTLDTVSVHPPCPPPTIHPAWPRGDVAFLGKPFSAARAPGSRSECTDGAGGGLARGAGPASAPGPARPRRLPGRLRAGMGTRVNKASAGQGHRPRRDGVWGASGPGGQAGCLPFALRPRKPLTPGGLARGLLPNPGLPLGRPLPHPTGRPGSARTPTSRPDGQAEGRAGGGPRTPSTPGSLAPAPPEWLVYCRAEQERGGPAGRRGGGAAAPGSGGGAGRAGWRGPERGGSWGEGGAPGREEREEGRAAEAAREGAGAGAGRRGWGWGSCLRGEPGRPLVRPPPLPSPAPGRGGRSRSGSRMVSAAALQPRPVAPGPRPGPAAGRPPRPRTLT